jgi:hypothetical protein
VIQPKRGIPNLDDIPGFDLLLPGDPLPANNNPACALFIPQPAAPFADQDAGMIPGDRRIIKHQVIVFTTPNGDAVPTNWINRSIMMDKNIKLRAHEILPVLFLLNFFLDSILTHEKSKYSIFKYRNL